MGTTSEDDRGKDEEADVVMDVERGVLRAVKESYINPVLRAYGPGGGFWGEFSIVIYKIGGRGLGYYIYVMIWEFLLLFPMPTLLLLSHITCKP